MLQGGYLLIKGLIKSKSNNMEFFNSLDELFEIPKQKEKPQRTQDELIADFERYIGV